jgi:ABC-type lipoprotein release transport system permease subunit
VIALLMTLISFGLDTFAAFPAGGVALAAVVSLVSGVILSTLASIYPSWAASRMAPMEAMRVE